LEKRISTDKLTGLLVESSYKQQGEQAVAYAYRHCTQLSLVCFEINQFSDIFVKHGKSIAEQILRKVASLINEGKRKEDIAARLGVSKFSLLLPSSDPEGAQMVVSRICERVARLKLKMGQDEFKIQFNTGLTSPVSCDDDTDFSGLLDQANSALKKSQDSGAGEIVCYQTGEAINEATGATAEDSALSIDDIIKQLGQQAASVSDQQLAESMRKILPLIANADSRLKLGLSKVILHLKKRLHR
jgi:diguanylate cyclase (GGDEF)-like protein